MRFKISGDGSTAVSMTEEWEHMQLAPLGIKVQVLTIGKIATHGVLTKENLKDYKGWAPLPKEPPWMRDEG
jgi:hypothetical protein